MARSQDPDLALEDDDGTMKVSRRAPSAVSPAPPQAAAELSQAPPQPQAALEQQEVTAPAAQGKVEEEEEAEVPGDPLDAFVRKIDRKDRQRQRHHLESYEEYP